MDTKHTYRRWFATQHPDNKARWFVQSNLMGGFDICEVSNYPKKANARLIAAAPELFQSVIDAIPHGVSTDNKNIPDSQVIPVDMTMGQIRRMKAAFKKATQP